MEILTKSDVDGVWIVDKTTDLVFCDEDGGYYYFQRHNYPLADKFSQHFSSMESATRELTTGIIEWDS